MEKITRQEKIKMEESNTRFYVENFENVEKSQMVQNRDIPLHKNLFQ